MKDVWINLRLVKCRCGRLITGKSYENTESNFKQHQKSIFHKEQMRLLKEAK